MPSKGKGPLNLFLKGKMTDKVDRPLKKPKMVIGSTIREMPLTTQLPSLPCFGKWKGLMMGHGPVSKKLPVLLLEDS